MISAKVCTAVMVALVGGTAAACGGAEAPATGDSAAVATSGGGAPAAMQHDMAGMRMDPAVMQQHAQEADSATAVMRSHIQQVRQLSAEEQHARIGEHVSQVSRMLSLMDRHMREMNHDMEMHDAHIGEMVGMSGGEHHQMMEEMHLLRAEAEQLQIASQAEVGQLMPAHLDRLDGMVRMVEQSAGHMHHP